MSLLQRYLAGDHEQVYKQLCAKPDHPDARAVAAEMMQRVRRNLDTLAARWRERGFALERPVGDKGAAVNAIASFEESFGPLPVTLRALYLELEFINFIEQPPDEDWPEVEQFDPLAIEPLEPQLEEMAEADEDEAQLVLFTDALLKFGIAGVGPIYLPLPAEGFDAELWFEGNRLEAANGSLIPYLRETILSRGGIAIETPDDALSSELIDQLTDGLEPF